MECHEGATMIKSFRGLMAVNAVDTILLHTNDGSTGYRIVKFQIMSNKPYDAADEHIVKIYKISQTGASPTVDFSDNTLLGVAIINSDSAGYRYATTSTIIFDQEIFNQDLTITASNTDGTSSVNYYIELEQVKLDLGENTVATLKDIRNTAYGFIT